MPNERLCVIPICNNRSGHHLAEKRAIKDLGRLPGSIYSRGPFNFLSLSDEELVQITQETAGRSVLAVYGGDGTIFTVADRIYTLLASNRLDPEKVLLLAMGSRDFGGFRIAAKSAGTDNKGLSHMLRRIRKGPDTTSTRLQPWKVTDTDSGKDLHRIFWIAAKSGQETGVLGIFLSLLEEERNSIRPYWLRSIHAGLDFFRTHNLSANVSVSVDGQLLPGKFSDAAVVLPPFLRVGPITFGIPEQVTLLTLTPGDRKKYELAIQFVLAAVSIGLLGIQSKNGLVSLRTIEGNNTVVLESDLSRSVVDSEIIPSANSVRVSSNQNAPYINVVSLRRNRKY